MKLVHFAIIAGIALSAPSISQAQVAGSTLLGVSYGELRDVTLGWSAKRQILGHPVYNNMDQRVGSVEDMIVTTDKSISYAIINVGGFLAVAKHNHEVKRTERRADRLEWEAGFAIDYAIASVEQANFAVLDAIDGRIQAELAKQA